MDPHFANAGALHHMGSQLPLVSPQDVIDYGTIVQPRHTVISIDGNAAHGSEQQPVPSRPEYSYYSMVGGGGLLGGLIGGAFAATCSLGEIFSGTGHLMGATALTSAGAICGAALGRAEHQSNMDLAATEIARGYRRDAKRLIEGLPREWKTQIDNGLSFFVWANKVSNPKKSVEFMRRPEYVVEKMKMIFAAAKEDETTRTRLFNIAERMAPDCHDRGIVGLSFMLDELDDIALEKSVPKAGDAGTEKFIERGKIVHRAAVLKDIAMKIANRGNFFQELLAPNFKREALELYAYFSRELAADLRLTNTIGHSKHADLYGQVSFCRVKTVKNQVLKETEQPGALRKFLGHNWPTWDRHVKAQFGMQFNEIEAAYLKRCNEIDNRPVPSASTASAAAPGYPAMNDGEFEAMVAQIHNLTYQRKMIEALTDHYFEHDSFREFDIKSWTKQEPTIYAQARTDSGLPPIEDEQGESPEPENRE